MPVVVVGWGDLRAVDGLSKGLSEDLSKDLSEGNESEDESSGESTAGAATCIGRDIVKMKCGKRFPAFYIIY